MIICSSKMQILRNFNRNHATIVESSKVGRTMTLQEIIQEVTTLSAHERKQLIHILLESLSIMPDSQPSKRIRGLHAGTTWMSDDFDEPLLSENNI